jgi:hypothetical protein
LNRSFEHCAAHSYQVKSKSYDGDWIVREKVQLDSR